MRVEYAHWKKDGGVRTRCTLLVALVVIVIISGSGVCANGGDNGHIDELNKLYEKLEKVKSEDILQADGEAIRGARDEGGEEGRDLDLVLALSDESW